ncbi:hypothetical protein JYU34_000322 [Plutella xylostella]|uniref:Uncharacterized protein n=1 Tax=Plutella xylostella TaxID=51655 RepID=A0ABQ7R7G2_PLUXY|nr:hypothetical protein JYU34_000322 [Plutella xylostella]
MTCFQERRSPPSMPARYTRLHARSPRPHAPGTRYAHSTRSLLGVEHVSTGVFMCCVLKCCVWIALCRAAAWLRGKCCRADAAQQFIEVV